MKKIILVLGLALALSGCQRITETFGTLKATAEAVGEFTVSPQSIIIASNVFDGIEKTATNYLKLKSCKKVTAPICRDPTATALLIPAVRSGRVARNNLQQFVLDHPNQLGPSGAFDALNASISTIQGVIAQYNIGA